MKLTIIKGKQSPKEYLLKGRRITIGNSSQDKSCIPDIDIWFDELISQKHALLERKRDFWYIHDMRSANGTIVGGKEIKGLEEPTEILPGIHIVIGQTILVIDPTNKHRASWQDITIAFDFPPVINYSLYHCGIPPLSNVEVKNIGKIRSLPFSLTFSIPEYSTPFMTDIPSLNPQENFNPDSDNFRFHGESLDDLPERVRVRLEVMANNELILEKEIWILGFYEWSFEPEFRKTLACFVQPGNPVIQRITADTEVCLKDNAGITSFSKLQEQKHKMYVNSVLCSLYNCLRDKYQLEYINSPVSHELKSQVIRPPHKVILDNEKRKGRGTCVDLTVLLVSCLESLKLKPLIIIVKENEWKHHAFAGCWATTVKRVDTILDYSKIHEAVKNEEMILIECTGFSNNKGIKLTYTEAVKFTEKQMSQEKFLYALDISALRNSPSGNITPIHYTSNPEILRIFRKSESLARQQKSKQINTAHLLYGFLAGGGETIKKVFERAHVNVVEAKKIIFEKAAQSFDGIPEESRNYKRARNDSKDLATKSGSSAIEEYHLFLSLLNLNSKNFKMILKSINTDVETLKEILDQVLRENDTKILIPGQSEPF